jgi:hypothetical protein
MPTPPTPTPATNPTPRQLVALANAVKEKLNAAIETGACDDNPELESVHEAFELASLLADLTQRFRLSERRDATRPNP